jgi:acetoin utilization protein AcuB
MLVRERMTPKPITVHPEAQITEALELIRVNNVRRLPVIDRQGDLIGIVSERDLLYASPSPATSLSIYELHYLLSKITVQDVMTKDVITVTANTPLEEAARVMADNKIGSLPVLQGTKLVGIVTETDLFKVFLELLGAREPGIRLTLEIPERKGEIARLTTEIARLGGNILALGTFLGDDPTTGLVTVKVEDVPAETLEVALRDLNLEIVDVRMTAGDRDDVSTGRGKQE